MKKKQCPKEADILKDRLRGRHSGEAEEHIRKCPVCRDSGLIQSWMKKFQEQTSMDVEKKPGIPDFESIWMKARTFPAVDRELGKRALLPLLVPRILLYIVIVLGIVFLITTKSESIKNFLYAHLKLGILGTILSVMVKNMLALLPYMVIPFGFLLFFLAGYFLYSLFHPRKI